LIGTKTGEVYTSTGYLHYHSPVITKKITDRHDELFESIQYIDDACQLNEIKDKALTEKLHNERAKLLRKGLGIVAFNMLEDFIRKRTHEVLINVSQSGIPFDYLSKNLQEASTLGLLRSLSMRAKVEKNNNGNWVGLIRDEAYKIYSTGGVPYELSKYSLGWSNSNVSSDNVKEILSAMNIKNGWGILKTVSDAIGGGLTSPLDSYKNAASRRHSSAHSPSFNYEYTFLNEIAHEIKSIAAAFDILLTAKYRQINKSPAKRIDQHNQQMPINFRYLEFTSQTYRESTVIGGRARKIWHSLSDAKGVLQQNNENKDEFIIILDSAKRITDWCI